MIEIENPSEFETYLKQDKPIILDFYTDSCNPCKSLIIIKDIESIERISGLITENGLRI